MKNKHERTIVGIDNNTVPAIVYVLSIKNGRTAIEVYDETEIDLSERDEQGNLIYQSTD